MAGIITIETMIGTMAAIATVIMADITTTTVMTATCIGTMAGTTVGVATAMTIGAIVTAMIVGDTIMTAIKTEFNVICDLAIR